MDPEATNEDFRTCPGCSNAVNINSSKQIYLIRLGEYWHEACFCCKFCSSPIPDCRYYCFEDYVCHMSCYDQENAPDEANRRPKDHVVCRVCQGLNKMCKWTLGNCKKDHNVGEIEQPHENVASVPSPVAEASQHKSTSSNEEDAVDTMSSIQTGKISSPQQSHLDNKASNEVQGNLEAYSSSQVQILQGESFKMAQIYPASSSSSSTANTNTNLVRCGLNSELYFIFDAITAKYGDISQNCIFSSAAFKSTFWEKICLIVKTLLITSVNDFIDYQMNEMFNTLDDIKKVGFEVEWLLNHLHKIKNIVELQKARIALQRLEDKQQELANLLKRSIELKEEELLRLKAEMEEAMVKCVKISHEIAVSEANLEQKHMDTLVDGLF